MVLFILITPWGKPESIWYKNNLSDGKNFVTKLKEIGEVYIDVPNFTNYLFEQDVEFKLEDIKFETYSQNLYDKVKKKIQESVVAIGLEEGCHYAFYFANKYSSVCIGLFLIGNRRFTKENYEKSLERGRKMMKIEYREGYESLIEDVSNENLKKLLKNPNERNKIMIGYYVGITLRGQYDDLPKKCIIPTYIYNRITLSKDVMLEHNLKDEKTRQIKDIYSEEKAIMAHCTTNMDKYESDKELIKNSEQNMVKTYYIANEDFNLFIYGTVGDEIIEKIDLFIRQSGKQK